MIEGLRAIDWNPYSAKVPYTGKVLQLTIADDRVVYENMRGVRGSYKIISSLAYPAGNGEMYCQTEDGVSSFLLSRVGDSLLLYPEYDANDEAYRVYFVKVRN